jgi:uncharacterized membrane protein YoaK (UPF0700 family)
VILTVVTGLVDAFSYLVLGYVFVANMTGNVVFLAFALSGALIGALVVFHVDRPLDLVVALALLVPVAVAAGRLSRSGPAWDHAV